MKLNKSIYDTNDAARAWYLSIRAILLHNGWDALVFEPASFVMRDMKNNIMAIVILHVDDFHMAIRPEARGGAVGILKSKVDFGSHKSCQEEAATFCGREYPQDAGVSVNITMKKYQESMEPSASRNIVHGPMLNRGTSAIGSS